MKKKERTNPIKKLFKGIFSVFDKLLINPLSRLAYFIRDKFSFKSGFIDMILNKPNVLLYLSLILAFVLFFAVDSKVINFTDTEAVVLENQTVNVEYNEEAYVIEGLPEHADVVLMGRKNNLYLAQQLENHKLSLDLTNLGIGTHKVKLEYNHPINALNYKLDPSTVTVIIYPKVSEVRTLSIDPMNTDKLGETLVVSNIVLDRSDIIIKSYQEKLSTVANVKALVDLNSINATQSGTYTIENVKLVAYDEQGKEIKDIEIVPASVTATVTITSPSKTVPIRIVPTGTVRSGSAISSITSNVNNVTVYADDEVLKDLNYIEVEIDVNDLSEDRQFQKYINKPNGARSISETAVTINVTMEQATTKEFDEVSIEIEGLDSRFMAQAASKEDAQVGVIVKGVSSLLDKLDKTGIKAYVDLSSITEAGTYPVNVQVKGTDDKLDYTSKTTTVTVIVTNR